MQEARLVNIIYLFLLDAPFVFDVIFSRIINLVAVSTAGARASPSVKAEEKVAMADQHHPALRF